MDRWKNILMYDSTGSEMGGAILYIYYKNGSRFLHRIVIITK